MRIATNISALNVQTNLNKSNSKLAILSNQMSTGLRITSVKDDASGFAIATKLDSQVRGLEKASKNTLDGVSMIQTLDGALASMTDMLQRARELSVQAANDSNTLQDREKMQKEVAEILDEIDNMQRTVDFNGKKLIGGDASRVTYNLDSAGSPQNITTVEYVSSTVPEGSLQYTIDSPGTPAYASNIVLPSGTTPLGVEGMIEINGVEIEVSKSDSGDDIQQKLLNGFNTAGLEFENGVLYTNGEGSRESLVINIDDELSGVGFTFDAPVDGTDAVLSGVEYVDVDGKPIDSFNKNIIVTANGNDVTVTSTNGQVIEVDIKFAGVNAAGDFVYGDSINQQDFAAISGVDYGSKVTNYGGIIIQNGSTKGMEVPIFIREINTNTLDIENENIVTKEGASRAITAFDNAIEKVSTARAVAGAYQNRFEMGIENLENAAINTETSLSRIRDVDMAKSMVEYSTEQVKMSAAMSILQQANERPEMILQLI